ncbi:organic hydroperoxide resistance protein [Novosphingobium malaysiense]|uniref:Organic hydroperoxide resistance protein n=1 Tax=Novosphingobium malaysiense TaxID=1348853 RepID=A0A0B1ZLX1_9SPHN|nr:organic hydroperoxide resistance protein [Novosphingobium malaysiense]KHK90339.1 hypothetical protein LK12_17170 [Novosphingobium malaysiense]
MSADEFQSIYTTHVTVSGGRTGSVSTDDGRLDLAVSMPKAMGGDDGPGTNPEQLFGAGYGACFLSALKGTIMRAKAKVGEPSVVASVSLTKNSVPKYRLHVDLEVTIPEADAELATQLVATAHQLCPYSEALRGNASVDLSVKSGGSVSKLEQA